MSESIFSIDFAARPEIVALGTLIIGFIVARMASAGVGLGLSALDKRTARVATTEASVLSPRLITFVRSFVFWLFLIFAVAVALQLLGLGGMSAILDVVIAFIPQALVGFIIVVAGHLIGLLVRNLVTHLDTTLTADSFVPRLLHGVIVVVAVVMGLQQVNVDITFVTRLILILVAVTGSGLVIAFALGARQHVANLMAHREIARLA
ncbi:MAG: hypothetical protein R3192_17975, partial [Woeseiaceae bacterium]|nr:hypothetical protein [Woeseiaceae bacterium]